MKKILIVMLLMITVLVLVACGSNSESNTPDGDPNNQDATNNINEPITEDVSEYEGRVSEKLAGMWHFGEGGFGFTFFSNGTAEMHFGATGDSEHPHPGSLNGIYTVHLTSDDLYRIDFEISDDKSTHEQIYGELPITQPFTYNYSTDELIFLGADDLDRPMLRVETN